jgi:hypothetical protein
MPRLLRGVWMFAPVAAHAAPYFGERGKFFAFGLSDIEHNTRPGNPMTGLILLTSAEQSTE